MNRKAVSLLVLLCFALSCFSYTAFAVSIPDVIDGPGIVFKPVDGSVTKVKYTLLDDEGEPISDDSITWSASAGILISKDGYIFLNKDVVDGKYTINAEVGGVSAPAKTITVKSGSYNDYSTGYDAVTSDGNGYIYKAKTVSYASSVRATKTSFVLDFDFMSSKFSGRKLAFYLQLEYKNVWNLSFYQQANATYYSFEVPDFSSGASQTKSYVSDIEYGKWANLKISVKYDDGNTYALYDVYLNNEKIFSDVKPTFTGEYDGLRDFVLRQEGFAMDNIKFYSGEIISPEDSSNKFEGITLTGENTVGTPRTLTPIKLQYDAKNIFGENLNSEMTWSVSPANQGVNVNDSGIVEITNNAQVGVYSINASVNGETYSSAMEVTDVNYELSIVGDDGVILDHLSQTEVFNFESVDNYNTKAKSSWSIENASQGIEITTNSDGEGVLTVSSSADPGVYTIKAVANSDENFDVDTATKTFTVSAATYAIDGPDSVTISGDGHYGALYKLKSSLGNVADSNVSWICYDALVTNKGKLIASSALPSALQLTAVFNGVSYNKNISIVSGSGASVPAFGGEIVYTGSNKMSLGDNINEKVLTAQLKDGSDIIDNAQIEWALTEVLIASDADLNDVYLSGTKLVVDGKQVGTVKVQAKVKNTNLTKDIVITFTDAYTVLSGNVLTVKGTASEIVTIKHYKPVNGTYLDAVLGYSGTPVVSTVNIPASGTQTTVDLDLSLNGKHKFVVENSTQDVNEYTVYVNDDKLFYQSDVKDLLSNARINEYLLLYTNKDSATIGKCTSLYSNLDSANKDKVLVLTNKEFNKYFASVLLVDYLNGNTANVADLKNELSVLNIDTTWVDSLGSDVNKSRISAKMLERNNAIENFTNDEYLLSAINSCSKTNTKEVKPYITLCNSSKYNGADEIGKNLIADAVSGKNYTSMSQLISDINNVDITVNSQGGASSSPSGGKTQTGSIGGAAPSQKPSEPATPQTTYIDVPQNHWAYSYIEYLSNKGIVNGNNSMFNPSSNVTRAEFVKMLVEAFAVSKSESTPFNDVDASAWYAPYVGGAFSTGLVMGDGQSFRPNEQITRQDAAVMIYRFAKYFNIEFSLTDNSFADGNVISDYAIESVNALAGASIINGLPDGTFAPQNSATRAEAAKMIYGIIIKGGVR